jgi:two-component system, NtrC family, sensor histidine kinase KinB
MIKNLSLWFKLLLAFLAIALMVGGFGYYQIRAINQINSHLSTLLDNGFVRLEQLNQIKVDAGIVENKALTYTHAILAKSDTATLTSHKNDLTQASQNLTDDVNVFDQLMGSDSSNPAEEKVLAAIRSANMKFLGDASNLATVAQSGSLQQLETKEVNLDTEQQQLLQSINDLIAQEDVQVTSQGKSLGSEANRISLTVIILTSTTTVAAVAMGVLLASRITGRITKITKGAERIANGDLSTPIPVPSHDEIGQLAKAFNAMSERLRESYRRLALQNERDSTLLESLTEGLIAIDEHTNIVLINDQAVQLLDLKDKESVTNLPFNHAVVTYDEKDQAVAAIQTPAVSALQTSQVTTGVFGYRKQNKAKILLNISASPFILEGKVAGAIMIIRDVTKEKEVDRMKTEFISLASHQLRTPLSAIRWFTEMLLNGDGGELNQEQKEFAQNAYDSTERMIQLVNGLLNISRIESGRIIVDPHPTDLHELVNGIINDLKAKTEEKQQTLIVSAHQDLPKVMLDPHLIGQVYMNLLTNAIKYTPKNGEITVFISKKDNQIVSQVTDNGYGIPKDQQGKMFQKFFRATNIAKFETDGTGLGMYLVKAIIESSGGKIWFESEEGKGTTFWFTLPMSGMQAREGEVTLDG